MTPSSRYWSCAGPTADGRALAPVRGRGPPRDRGAATAARPGHRPGHVLGAASRSSSPRPAGATAHALLYPPTNPRRRRGPPEERPPLLVLSHGGPTSAARPQLDLGDRSSGRAAASPWSTSTTAAAPATAAPYRDALDGQWGIVDVDDCVAAAAHLAERGVVDRDRLAIRGGSAGGYTTLCALAFRDDVHAPAPATTASPTSRRSPATPTSSSRATSTGWSARTRTAGDVYVERSPIHHTEGFACPLIVFQGLEDQVVPPDQAEMMVDALRREGRARRLRAVRGRAARLPPGAEHHPRPRGGAVVLRPGLRLRTGRRASRPTPVDGVSRAVTAAANMNP